MKTRAYGKASPAGGSVPGTPIFAPLIEQKSN